MKTRRARVILPFEKFANQVFERAYEAAKTEERKKSIADIRKLLKVVAISPSIVRSKIGDDKTPLVLHHWVTLKCNASCEQCLWKDNSRPQMNTGEIKKFYTEAAEAGIVSTLIGGGEPQLRSDIGEIYRYAKEECGWKVGTATNGFFVEKRIDEFGDCLDTIIVSFDSADPKKHDRIRGIDGLFEKAYKGIKKIRKEYPFIHAFINTCLDNNSVDEVEDIIALGDELGVPVAFDVITTVQHTSEQGTIDRKSHLIDSYEKVGEALHKIIEAKKRGAVVFNSEHYLNHFECGKQPYECRYPYIYLRVMPDGDVEDCMQIDNPIGNVLETPIAEILASERMEQFRLSAAKCSSCSSPAMIDSSYFYDNPAGLISELTVKRRKTKA